MSMRKHPGRSRALRPSAEGLEGRQLLAATVTGQNTVGDVWTLKLTGRGSLQVLKQDDASGNPAPLDSASEIRSITISGSDPTSTRLTGTVRRAAGSTGRIFFQELNELSNRSLRPVGGLDNLGIQSINMPDFYLGVTDPTSTGSSQPRAQINIPDGINSLRFGGVDTTAFFGTDPAQSVTQDGQSDIFLVSLGLPTRIGTSIVVDRVVSSAQAGTTSSNGTTNNPTQNSVIFDVAGRLNLFQANEIDGNTQFAPAAASFNAGTIVSSYTDNTTGSPITGSFGFIRVGGNATNFSAVTNDKIANFYVGGEANNVNLLTPNGSRNLYFGKGLDTTTVLTNSVENLFANRGAVNSRVVADRLIGDVMLGGDVANSTFLAGYVQGLATVAGTVQQNLNNLSLTQAASIPTPTAQANGQITAFVSGDVTDSVFAASVQPISQLINSNDQTFGNPQDANLPLGQVTARVQGTISNETATPDSPETAFYGKRVKLTRGPVSPPRVVEPPLPPPGTPSSLPGIPVVFPRSTAAKAGASKAEGKS